MCNNAKPNFRRWLKSQMLKHMHGMITCAEFEDFVLNYLDGELPPRQRRVFKLHLYVCRECREYLKAYEKSIELSKLLVEEPNAPVPTEVPEDLIKAILAAKKCMT